METINCNCTLAETDVCNYCNVLGLTATTWYTSPTVPCDYKIEDNEKYWNVDIPVPGVTLENIDIRVKNNTLTVNISEGIFVSRQYYQWDFDYKLKPKMISSAIEDGVLTITIIKPKNSEFKVEIN